MKSAAVVTIVSLLALLGVAAIGDRVVGHGQIRYQGLGPERWAQRWRQTHRRLVALRHARRKTLLQLVEQPRMAITLIFGRYAGQALAVADCETGGTYSTTARNGQYLGLFQMGSSERARYGHGTTALAQARAAYVYFVNSGRDWSPWTCKP